MLPSLVDLPAYLIANYSYQLFVSKHQNIRSTCNKRLAVRYRFLPAILIEFPNDDPRDILFNPQAMDAIEVFLEKVLVWY
jgi:hypothetical protein